MKKLLAAAVISAFCVPVAFAQAPGKKEVMKGDPKVHECREHNGKEHAELMKMHAEAKKAGNISKAEETHFHSMEQRLVKHRQALMKDGLTLKECEALGKQIANEKTVLAKMASTPNKPPAKK
jgi:hypothetical protein